MRLGEKTTVKISEKFIERNRPLNTLKFYCIVIDLKTIDSHMFSIVNL